jgi:hypothetical protein
VLEVTESIDLPLRYLWAKSASGALPEWHPLVLHLLDVAASADAILELFAFRRKCLLRNPCGNLLE